MKTTKITSANTVIDLNIKSQRNIAKEILKVGKNKVWIDPQKTGTVQEAITKNDIRKLISEGTITAKPVIGTSTARSKKTKAQKKKGRMSGFGKRKGTKTARTASKKTWIKKIRAQRKELKNLKSKSKITAGEYRHLYLKSSAGVFKDKTGIHLYIKKMKS